MSADVAIVGEVVCTPDARKSHAAFVRQGARILFMFPVDTPQEGEAKIDEAIALLADMGMVRRAPDSERRVSPSCRHPE